VGEVAVEDACDIHDQVSDKDTGQEDVDQDQAAQGIVQLLRYQDVAEMVPGRAVSGMQPT